MAETDLFTKADTFGDAGPRPRPADVAVQAVMRGEEFRNFHGKTAVLALQQSGNRFHFVGRWRYVELLIPHDDYTWLGLIVLPKRRCD